MKNILCGLFLLLSIPTFAFAHGPIYESRPYPVYSDEETRAHINSQCDLPNDSTHPSYDQDKCRITMAIELRAYDTRNKDVCREIGNDTGMGEYNLSNGYDACAYYVEHRPFVESGQALQNFSRNIAILGFIASAAYFLWMLYSYGQIRKWIRILLSIVILYIPLFIYIIIANFISVFAVAFSLSQLGAQGNLEPIRLIGHPLHDILFILPGAIPLLFIFGVLIFIISFGWVLLCLKMFFGKLISPRDRLKIALVFSLVFDVFFFPIGLIIAIMHGIYTYRRSRIS